MKPTSIMKYLFVALFLTSACAGQTAETQDDPANRIQRLEHPELTPLDEGGRQYVPGEILVKFKDGTGGETIEIIQRDLSLETIRVSPNLPLHRMRILDGSSVEDVMERLEGFDEVEYSEPNYIMRLQ